jgi:hypothetical protein
MFAIGRKFGLLFIYILIATAVLIWMPERITQAEWLQVFVASVVVYIGSRWVLSRRVKKLEAVTRVPVKKRTWLDKLKSWNSPEVMITAISIITVSCLWIFKRLDFTSWWSACSAVFGGVLFWDGGLKEIEQEKV